MSGPKKPNANSSKIRHKPNEKRGLRTKKRPIVRPTPAAGATPPVTCLSPCGIAVIGPSPFPGCPRAYPGVNEAVGDVNEEVRQQHRYHDQQRDPLDHRVVTLADRGKEQRADAGV